MRHWLCAALIGVTIVSSTGCLIPAYSGDPSRRSQQLLNTSENLRLLLDEWERLWMLDQPSHLTPYANHGGLL